MGPPFWGGVGVGGGTHRGRRGPVGDPIRQEWVGLQGCVLDHSRIARHARCALAGGIQAGHARVHVAPLGRPVGGIHGNDLDA